MPIRYDQLVIYDIDYPPFMGNRAFDRTTMVEYPGATAISLLAERLSESGIAMVTADVFLEGKITAESAVVLSNEVTRFTRELILGRGLKGAICLTGESPIVAWRFYAGLRETSMWYDHLVLFEGARPLASDGPLFHPYHWPYPGLRVNGTKPWSERALLALISGNKRSFGWPKPAFDFSHPKVSAGRWYRAWQARNAQAHTPWMQSELYLERLEAIRHFGASQDFDLYGRGWNQPTSGADRDTQRAIDQSYRGEIPPLGKVEVLEDYKFSICFENTVFPGYTTEKIFDCLVAGNIPVYLGAPDITEYVPAEVFIDFRDFRSYADLEEHLRGFTVEDAERMHRATRTFLASPDAARFTESHFVELVGGLLMQALGNTR